MQFVIINIEFCQLQFFNQLVDFSRSCLSFLSFNLSSMKSLPRNLVFSALYLILSWVLIHISVWIFPPPCASHPVSHFYNVVIKLTNQVFNPLCGANGSLIDCSRIGNAFVFSATVSIVPVKSQAHVWMLHLNINWLQFILTDCRIDINKRIDVSVYYYAYQPLWRFSFLIYTRVTLCVERSDAKMCFCSDKAVFLLGSELWAEN